MKWWGGGAPDTLILLSWENIFIFICFKFFSFFLPIWEPIAPMFLQLPRAISFRFTAYTPSLPALVRILRSWERFAFFKPYPLAQRSVIPGAYGAEKCGGLCYPLLSPPPLPSERRANYATPYEPVELSLWQGRDLKPRLSVCNNSKGKLKPQPHSLLP